MPSPHTLRRWEAPSGSAGRPRSRRRHLRPRLEGLEVRVVPAHNITIALGGLAAIPAGAETFGDAGDYTIAPSALDGVAAGNVTLRANNDITVINNIHMADGVGLSLIAGRNLTLNTEINFFLAPLALTANAATALGVDQANRDPGDAALILSNAILNSSTTNTATLTGDVGDQDGANTHPTAPVLLLGATQFVNSGVVISGRGNAGNPVGIEVSPETIIAASGDFDIDLTGTSFNGNQNFTPGVDIGGAVTTAGGDITVRGTGAGRGESGYGINVGGPSAGVRASGGGAVTLLGVGGTGEGSFGVEIDGQGDSADPIPIVETVDGPLTIDGKGGGTAFRFGVSIEHRAQVRATGSGNVVIDGRENGVSFDPFDTSGGFASVGTGSLTLTGDVIHLDDPGSVAAEGQGGLVTYQPSTRSRPIALGFASFVGRLVLGDASLAAITGFRDIVVGRSDGTGFVEMNGAIPAIDANLTVLAPGFAAGGFVVSETLDVGANTLTLRSGTTITQAGGGLLKAARLALEAASGLGASGNPLRTEAANLEAVSQTGGVFVGNTGDLAIGGASADLFGVRAADSGDVSIFNAGGVSILANGDIVKGTASVAVQATGAASDVKTGGNNAFAFGAVVSTGGTVTLAAGRDILIGDTAGAGAFGTVQGGGSVVLTAGRDIVVDESTAVRALGTGTIAATAGRNITLARTHNNQARLATEGGDLTLTTGAGGLLTIDADTPNIGRNIDSGGKGDILIIADRVDLTRDDSIRAGAGTITIRPRSAGRPIDLGSTTDAADALELSDAELDRLLAGAVQIGDDAATSAINLTAPITQPAGYDALGLATAGAIRDANTTGIDLAVGRLSLVASAGVGGAADPIETRVGRLDARTGTGGLFVANTGDLAIDAPGLQVAGTAGDIAVTATGNLALDRAGTSVRGPGDILLRADGSLSIGRDIASTGVGKRLTLAGTAVNVGASTLSGGSNGRILFTGSTSLTPATTLAVVLDPARAGGPPLIEVNGSIDLGGANLQAAGPGGSPLGTAITLVGNDGAEAVSATFAQGSGLVVAGEALQIRYDAGDGNDVVVLRPVPPPTPTPAPTVRPISVKLVTRRVGQGRRKTKALFVQVVFTDDALLKAEIKSPLQAPKFRNIRFTTADTNQDGVIDRVTLSGRRGNRTRRVTLAV